MSVTERALTEQLADLLDEERLAQLLLTRKRILVELCERRDQAPGCLPM